MVRFEPYELSPEARAQALRLRWQMSANRALLACNRLESLLRKANFNLNEARVPAGSSEGGRWTGGGGGSGTSSRAESGRAAATRVAAGAGPLRQRSGDGPAARVSSALNAIASGQTNSLATTIGSGLESATVKIDKQGSQITVNSSMVAGSLRAIGTLSSKGGQVTISNLKLSTPGFLNPLTVQSAPTQITLSELNDGRLGLTVDRRLTITVPIRGKVVDAVPGQTYIIPDR